MKCVYWIFNMIQVNFYLRYFREYHSNPYRPDCQLFDKLISIAAKFIIINTAEALLCQFSRRVSTKKLRLSTKNCVPKMLISYKA